MSAGIITESTDVVDIGGNHTQIIPTKRRIAYETENAMLGNAPIRVLGIDETGSAHSACGIEIYAPFFRCRKGCTIVAIGGAVHSIRTCIIDSYVTKLRDVRVSVNIFKNSYSLSLSQHCDGSTVNVGAMIPKF